MRVAILGNMNNNANNLIRYLIDRGMDCDLLFYSNEDAHFTPDADNVHPIKYHHKTLTWGSYLQLFTTPASKIRDDLAPYDFIIGSRLAPSYLLKAGRYLDVFMPTGGDIWTVPVFTKWSLKNLTKFVFFSRNQRLGIQQSKSVFFDLTNIETEKKISTIIDGVPRYAHAIPCIYLPDYEGEYLAQRLARSQLLPLFKRLRHEADVFLVHHVKHLWKKQSVQEFDVLQEKGNDRIFHAIAQFKKSRPQVRLKILMTEYGSDYKASQALAEELGVQDCIQWIALAPRRELMMAIHLSDGVIGEVARSWYSYGTILEGMAMGKPILHHRDDAYFSKRSLYPMLNVTDAPSILRALTYISDHPEEAVEMGRLSKKWLTEIGIGSPINDIDKLFKSKVLRINAEKTGTENTPIQHGA